MAPSYPNQERRAPGDGNFLALLTGDHVYTSAPPRPLHPPMRMTAVSNSAAWSSMYHIFTIGRNLLPDDFCFPSEPLASPEKGPAPVESPYDAWLASRTLTSGGTLVPGAHRRFSLFNFKLACIIIRTCAFDFVSGPLFFPTHGSSHSQFTRILCLHPVRTTLMMSLNVVRSIFPAFRGYSQVGSLAVHIFFSAHQSVQALIIDEVRRT